MAKRKKRGWKRGGDALDGCECGCCLLDAIGTTFVLAGVFAWRRATRRRR